MITKKLATIVLSVSSLLSTALAEGQSERDRLAALIEKQVMHNAKRDLLIFAWLGDLLDGTLHVRLVQLRGRAFQVAEWPVEAIHDSDAEALRRVVTRFSTQETPYTGLPQFDTASLVSTCENVIQREPPSSLVRSDGFRVTQWTVEDKGHTSSYWYGMTQSNAGLALHTTLKEVAPYFGVAPWGQWVEDCFISGAGLGDVNLVDGVDGCLSGKVTYKLANITYVMEFVATSLGWNRWSYVGSDNERVFGHDTLAYAPAPGVEVALFRQHDTKMTKLPFGNSAAKPATRWALLIAPKEWKFPTFSGKEPAGEPPQAVFALPGKQYRDQAIDSLVTSGNEEDEGRQGWLKPWYGMLLALVCVIAAIVVWRKR